MEVIKQNELLALSLEMFVSALEHTSVPLAPPAAFLGHVTSASFSSGRKASVMDVIAHLPIPLPIHWHGFVFCFF